MRKFKFFFVILSFVLSLFACDDGIDINNTATSYGTGYSSPDVIVQKDVQSEPEKDEPDVKAEKKEEQDVQVEIEKLCPEGFIMNPEGKCVDCLVHADCDDGNVCTMNSCDAETGACTYTPISCDDDDPTTEDTCQEKDGGGHECVHVSSDCTGGCNDSDSCTVDYCVDNTECVNEPLKCGTGTKCIDGQCVLALCVDDGECDDKNVCTTDSCESGVCVSSAAVECDEGKICNPSSGECLKLEAPDCAEECDDNDPATIDYCNSDTGKCVHHQPVTCGQGTALNPDTGECEVFKEDITCIEGEQACIQFEDTQLLNFASCKDKKWFVDEICGPIADSFCKMPDGCQDVVPDE